MKFRCAALLALLALGEALKARGPPYPPGFDHFPAGDLNSHPTAEGDQVRVAPSRIANRSIVIAGLLKAFDQGAFDHLSRARQLCHWFDDGQCSMLIMAPQVDAALVAKMQQDLPGFHVVPDPPDMPGGRTPRLAALRNRLLQGARETKAEYLLMADLDNLVTWDDRTFGAILNVLRPENEPRWDGVTFAATTYYDWWAARCDEFSMNCWEKGNCFDKAKFPCIQKAEQASDWNQFFPVRSAFNGLAIYKQNTIGQCQYDGTNLDHGGPDWTSDKSMMMFGGSDPKEDCEHVAFHDCLRQQGRHFMLNSGKTHIW